MAAEVLHLSCDEVIRKAKRGELPMRYQAGVSKRMAIQAGTGRREVTVREGAQHLKSPLVELERRIEAGEIDAYHKEEHTEIRVVTRWEYEKCPLWKSVGVCYDFSSRE